MKKNKLKLLTILLPLLVVGACIGIYISKNKMEDTAPVIISTCKQDGTSVFVFKENPNDAPELYMTLILSCDDLVLKGYMFGPYPAQEHGLFYFSNALEDLNINGTNISFKISSRDFFSEPFTMKNYMDKPQSTSFSRYLLTFNGTIDQNFVDLKCQSEPLECYSESMKFIEEK